MKNMRLFKYVARIITLAVMLPASVVQAQPVRQNEPLNCPPHSLVLLEDETVFRQLPPECQKIYRRDFLSKQQVNSEISTFAFGGPDGFGYTFDDTVPYSWVSASTNSGVTGDDASSGPVSIGFNFPFYGFTQNQLYFNTNGLITFGVDSRWDYGGPSIPHAAFPNNLIAPFWEDLIVGVYGNSGAIYTMQGGSAPNRYFVIEWRNVETFSGSSPFSFEAILHENGDIVFQHQSLPGSYYSTVGIENSLGDDGLGYQWGFGGLSAPKAIRYYHPAPAARVWASPMTAGSFSAPGAITEFTFTISNIGSLGADVYDMTTSSTWPLTLYAADGITALTDTDSDGIVDTGSVSQGNTVNVIARFETPNTAQTGEGNIATITAASSLNITKTKTVDRRITVPTDFVNVFENDDNGAMSFMTAREEGTNTYKATADGYYGEGVAVTRLVNGNYLYSWTNYLWTGSVVVGEVEYAILGGNGSIVRPAAKVADHSGATMDTYDSGPSVASAPNGTIGIVWMRNFWNSTNQGNYNIYFAALDGSGNLLTGPTNITNNSVWGTWSDPNVPRYYYPTIASTDDNRFILGWEEYSGTPNYFENIWYAVRDTAGASVLAPTKFTSDNMSWSPVLNSLTGGKAILTWVMNGYPQYAVINSSGSIFKTATSLAPDQNYSQPDAVLLPNGKTAVAWPAYSGVQFSILDTGYNIESGPISANNPSGVYEGYSLSVTTDPSSRVIMTWGVDSHPYLLYALADSSGALITQPMPYTSSSSYISTSWNGQGNAPYPKFTDVSTYYWAGSWIERLAQAGITGGCGTGIYCPESSVTRAQMAVFLEKGMAFPSTFTPPNVAPTFGDTAGHWAEDWIEALKNDGVTAGCAPGLYCPENPVTRAQMAVFLLKAKYGSSYIPPTVGASTGFGDVPTTHWAAAWIKQLAAESITGGCGGGNYCPENPVTRAQMAVFLVKTFGLP